jgi:RNA polymerase sigma factor (sigma-70 family)
MEARMSYSSALPGMPPALQEEQQARGHASSTTTGTSTDSQGADSASSLDETQALSLLYEQSRRSIYSYSYRLLGNREDAADVTQEVFLRACLSWKSLRDHERLGVWLHHVATNACLDLLRRRRRLSWWPLTRYSQKGMAASGVSEDDPISLLPPDDGGIPEIAERDHIRRVFAHLPQEYAIVLILSTVQGLPYQDIATIIGLSPTATAARISRAKKLFVAQYQRLSHDGGGKKEQRP